jgi:dimeric dUTPase (all-alpha-NTP-PPase superfamily)
MQKALNERIGVQTESMNEAEKTLWILNYCRAVNQEVAELTDSVPWKWWAKYQKFNEQNARVEVVDLFHFVISLAQVLGMTADDVFAAYCKKNEVNLSRQDSGYLRKDEADSKHI